MRIFALETDIEKLKKGFCSTNEQELLTVRYHGFLFFARVLRQTLLFALLVGVCVGAYEVNIPGLWITGILLAGIVFAILPPLVVAYIDWKYDILIVTTEKIVMVNQSSVFHMSSRQMNMENFATVTAETQYWNLFGFGVLHFDLKEGVGRAITLRFVPDAEQTAARIADTITQFQRRRAYQQGAVAGAVIGQQVQQMAAEAPQTAAAVQQAAQTAAQELARPEA